MVAAVPEDERGALIQRHALQLPCDYCGAAPGEVCTIRGRPGRRAAFTHAAREDAAVDKLFIAEEV